MDPSQTPPPPNFSQKPKYHIFFFLKPSLIKFILSHLKKIIFNHSEGGGRGKIDLCHMVESNNYFLYQPRLYFRIQTLCTNMHSFNLKFLRFLSKSLNQHQFSKVLSSYFVPVLYFSMFIFYIWITFSFMALVLAPMHLCNILSSFWEKMDRRVTTVETRTVNHYRNQLQNYR